MPFCYIKHIPLAVPPALARGLPSLPTPGTPLMPDNPGEAYVVVDLPGTPEIVVVSSKDEVIEDFEGHLEKEGDPEEDQDIDKAVVEQQWHQEINKMILERQVKQEPDDVESGLSDRSFDSGEDPKDESNPDYDLSRDR